MTIEKIEFGGQTISIDSEKLRFNEDSLNVYIQTEAGYYDNYGAFLALAERNLQIRELQFDKTYSERFDEAKENGCTEKQSEARAKADASCVKLKEEIIDARYAVNRLKNHLKAWDKNHDNAQSMGHMLRKQMDKISGDIMMKQVQHFQGEPGIDDKVEEAIKDFETDLTLENL